MVLHALHLCAGYGGFELALRLAGVPVRTVAHVERESHAAAALVARMEDQALDRAPVWSDIETFDGRPWRGRVDLVTAGFPCPDFSAAGQRAGVHGDHWLWPECARVIREVAPRIVFLENVPGLVRLGGLTRVLSDLAGFGFDAEWGLLSAAAVGATHQRERFWLLAHTLRVESGQRPDIGSVGGWSGDAEQVGVGSSDVADSDGDGLGRIGGGLRERRRIPSIDTDRPGGPHVGDAGREGRPEVTRSASGDETPDGQIGRDVADGAGKTLGLTDSPRFQGSTVERPQLSDAAGTSWPPLPDDIAGWADYIAEGGPEPQVRRSSDGRPLGLADALHLGGNGLVPRVAAEAFAELAVRLGIGERVTVSGTQGGNET